VSTRDDVLARLKAAGAAGASGETIARELGVSRAAVAKHAATLRASGYEIDATAGSGYVLRSCPDVPLPAEVAPLVSDGFWVRIEGAETTGSTNDDARALARAGAPEGTVVLAARQTEGRGRLGRRWDSPEGGVYLSAVLRPAMAPVTVAPLALVIGLGVAEALERLGAQPRLKWPNDVLLDGGKVAGILLEMSAEADRVEWVVAGVGVNVHAPQAPRSALDGGVDERLSSRPAFLGDVVADVSRPAIAAALLDAIAVVYRRFVDGGFVALAEDWTRRDALAGADVTVRNAGGDEVASGRARGVDEDGRLRVETSAGVVAVPAGEVTLRS
jgi:BirA family biotin operon repressor/biotin-[acetyl-CoA-carboxylase] ligase